MTFLKNVLIVAIVFGKTLLVFAVVVLASVLTVGLAFPIGAYTHWSLGAAYGVASTVVVTAGFATLLDKAKSDRPIHDWLMTIPFGEVER